MREEKEKKKKADKMKRKEFEAKMEIKYGRQQKDLADIAQSS